MAARQDEMLIHVATVGRPHGVRGCVHLFALTESPHTLARLSPLQDETGGEWTVRWNGQGVALLESAASGTPSSREQAAALVNMKLFALRTQFPKVEEDEFYHADLIGMSAFRPDGDVLGEVTTVHDYGGGVSVEITGAAQSWIIPFTKSCVPSIDLAAKRLEVVLPVEIEVEGDPSTDADVLVRR